MSTIKTLIIVFHNRSTTMKPDKIGGVDFQLRKLQVGEDFMYYRLPKE